jgi:flagellar biosynthetic protein FliO
MIAILLTSAIAIEEATPEGAVDFTWLFIKMLLVLVIVCVSAIIFLKYVLPQLGIARGGHKGRFFKVHGRYQLEPRKSLYVVEVGGRYLVIGCADHGIKLITELSPEEAMGDRGSKAK